QQFAAGQQAAQFNNQARTQALQEAAYQQNLPLQQFSQLLGLGQVTMPQGVNYSPLTVGQTDVLGAYGMSQAQQNANYQAKQQQQAGLMNGLFGLGSAALTLSDRRLKRDIRRIGALADGLPVYLYRFLWCPIWQVGVMAQDVLKSKPQAVHRVNGFLAVDYGAL
ncbi:MAG: hypothetical protein JWM33_2132, partial [Caulobacteraceae bacterium]|nr:hypothetical protein [Caulobacteraceae bacterium]